MKTGSHAITVMMGVSLWLAAAGLAAAQRVGDAPARSVNDAPFNAVKDVRFDLPVTNGLVLYLAADRIDGLTDGAGLTEWLDASGSGNHAIQTTAARKPLYIAAGWRGWPVVRFDKGQHWMTIAHHPSLALDAATIFLLFRPASPHVGGAADARTLWDKREAGVWDTDIMCFYRPNGAYFNRYYGQNGNSDVNQTGVVAIGDWHLVASRYHDSAGREDRITIDGNTTVFAGAGQGAIKNKTRPLRVGSRADNFQPIDADIGEFLIYNRALSDAERGAVEEYLGKKWMDW